MCDSIDEENTPMYPVEQTGRSTTEFILSPDIPEEQKKAFSQWWSMINHLNALGNISKEDIASSLLAFDEIIAILEIGDYDWAMAEMGRELMLLQKTRSVGGFATQYAVGSVERSYVTQNMYEQSLAREKKSKWYKFGRKMGRKDLPAAQQDGGTQ